MTRAFRTHRCGEVSGNDIGSQVRLSGWVASIRNLGRIAFVTLRDSSGVVQLAADQPDLVALCRQLRTGWAIMVDGHVDPRPDRDINPDLPTGALEIRLAKVEILARSQAVTPYGDDGGQAGRLVCGEVTAEVATHRLLAAQGFSNIGGRPPGPLAAFLPQLDRVYHVRITRVAEAYVADGVRTARLVEFAMAFATRAELVQAARELLNSVQVGSAAPVCLATQTDDWVHAVVNGRIVGLGAVESHGLDGNVPGTAWFVLDLTRFVNAVRRNRPVETGVAAHDLASLRRAAVSPRLESGRLCTGGDGAELIDRWDVEASAAMARSRHVPGIGDGFRALLDDFAMDEEVCERLLDVTPSTRDRIERMPAGERFTWLWSIIGSESTRAVLRDEHSYAVIERAVDAGVITDAKQLTYVDIPSLANLATVLDSYPHASTDAGIVPLLRQVLAVTPGPFTALLAALAEADPATRRVVTRSLNQGRSGALREAVGSWACTPGILPAVMQLADAGHSIDVLTSSVRALGPLVFPNVPVEDADLAKAMIVRGRDVGVDLSRSLNSATPETVANGILHHLFRPISLTYPQIIELLSEVKDCHEHVQASGLRPGGAHWIPGSGRYEFTTGTAEGVGSGRLGLYLSKNSPSALAKGTVGICTARDLTLFHRPDHHHLNVVDAWGVVVGNAQLHVAHNSGTRILMIRAINTTSSKLTASRARAVVEATLVACVELALGSDIDEVHLGEGLSFWHLNSSRPQIRAVLESLYSALPCVHLDRPFFLFRFGPVDLEINKTYRVWARRPERAGDFRLDKFLEVVI